MRLDHPLDDVFATRSHIRVLRALFELPGGVGASGREIARRAGLSAPSARDALVALVDQGLVRVERSPKNASYRVNSEHVLASAVADLLLRERHVASELEHDLSVALGRLPGITAGWIFGSATRSDMRANSDIDVAVESTSAITGGGEWSERIHRRFGNRLSVVRLSGARSAALRERLGREGKPIPISRRKGRG